MCIAFVAIAFVGIALKAQQGPRGGQWPNHSGDKGSTKYSPLDQITKNNVKNLRVVWRRAAVADEFRKRRADLVVPNLFRSTPLMMNGVLFASNGVGLVEAFDPATGKTVWVQEPPELSPDALNGSSTRGVGYSARAPRNESSPYGRLTLSRSIRRQANLLPASVRGQSRSSRRPRS